MYRMAIDMKKTALCFALMLCVLLFSSCAGIKIPVDWSVGEKTTSQKQGAVSNPHTQGEQNGAAAESRHYYNRLDDAEQKAYRSMLEGVNAHESRAALPMLTEAQISKVFQALCYDNPQIICLQNQFGWGKNGSKTFIEFHYTDAVQSCADKTRAMEAAVSEAMSRLHSGMDDFEKELALHDWLAERCEYSEGGASPYTAYGALVGGSAVCEGYSKAMLLLLNRAGISGFLATGQAMTNGVAGGHMWNIVTLGGENYHLDVTWNVPKGEERLIQHAYFNLTDEQISADHFDFDAAQSGCASVKENYYVRTGALFASYGELAEHLPDVIAEVLAEGGDVFEFRLSSRESYEQAVAMLFGDEKIYDILDAACGKIPGEPNVSNISHVDIEAQYTILCKLN